MNTQEKNKAIVRQFNKEVIEEGNIASFHKLVAPDAINHTAPSSVGPSAGGILKIIIDVLRPAFADLTVEIHDQVAENDLVVTRKSIRGIHIREFMGIQPSGVKVSLGVIDIVRVKNNRYSDHWGMRDISELVAASQKTQQK